MRLAAMCRTPEDKRHPHQRRLPEKVLQAAHSRLSKTDLQSCDTFEELHDRIEAAIRPIPNVGPLTVYDIALRLGAYLRLEPERIYLHSGTKVGARMLGVKRWIATLGRQDLPEAFRILKPREIEDCLCIYKDELRRLRSSE